MNFPMQPVHGQTLKDARLRKHSDYQRAYAAARKRQSASMSWFLAPQPAAEGDEAVSAPLPGAGLGPRVGLTAGKVLGKAHERNRIKRRMREALRRHVELLPEGFDLILHPRRMVLTLEFSKLEAEVVRILQQANAEARRGAGVEEARTRAAEPKREPKPEPKREPKPEPKREPRPETRS
jgi:ribonuclease P protein component